jgi:16S rRNA (guanine966-N2)-methyltransferase
MNHTTSSGPKFLITTAQSTAATHPPLPGMLGAMAKPRIVGGSARGRELETPKQGTRPSPSRLREALFDVLAFEPRGRFLDLFSGSGAIGLEAASRGWEATLVDLSAEACAVMRRNAARLGLPVTVVKDDAVRYASSQPGGFDVVFAAPPYTADLRRLFAGVLASGAARAGGLYVLQHPSDMAPQPDPSGPLADAEVRSRRYGSNAVTFVRVPEAG